MDFNAFNLNAIYEATRHSPATGFVTLFLSAEHEEERIHVVKVIDALELAGIQVKLTVSGENLAELLLS